MGMSTHIVGIRPPDDDWLKKKAVWDVCEHAGVPVPESVVDFFGGEKPDPKGVLVDLDDGYAPVATEYNGDSEQGYEVRLDDLPEGVKIIRFYNSW